MPHPASRLSARYHPTSTCQRDARFIPGAPAALERSATRSYPNRGSWIVARSAAIYTMMHRRPPRQWGYSHEPGPRSEEHTSELQSLMRISYAVFCLKKKNINTKNITDRKNKL